MGEKTFFFKSFLKHPGEVGAVAPTSVGMVCAMLDWFDWENARTVVEFGSGTGVFTEQIIQRLHPKATFFAIEKSAELAAETRKRCPSVTVYEDSVANLAELCEKSSIDKIDAVISALPWAAFPQSLQEEIMEAILARLHPESKFTTIAYWQGMILPSGMRFKKRLRQTFGKVQRSPTGWKNLPPAFAYRCTAPHL